MVLHYSEASYLSRKNFKLIWGKDSTSSQKKSPLGKITLTPLKQKLFYPLLFFLKLKFKLNGQLPPFPQVSLEASRGVYASSKHITLTIQK